MKKQIFLIILFLAVFVWDSLYSFSLAAERGPIKVGFIAPTTGQWAEIGKDMANGFNMYMEEIGYKAAGRKLVIIQEDTQALPEIAVTKTRKLATHDKVAVEVGCIAAPEGLAVNAAAGELELPLIISTCAVDDLTQRLRNKWAVRTSYTGSQPMYAFGDWVYKKLGYKKIVTIGVDFQYGYDAVGGFQKAFEDAGGKVIQKIWAPPNTNDFGPYLANINRKADAIFNVMAAGMSLKYPKQYMEAGFKIPNIASFTTIDEFILQAQGDEVLGYISPANYSPDIDNPANKKFQENYQKKYKKVGSFYAVTTYEAGMWLVKAIEEVKGDVENKENFVKALRNVKLTNNPRGPFSLDNYANPVQDIYIRKTVKINGVKWNKIIDVCPNVSQFWKWSPEEYLNFPKFSRDYPPCKYCE